MKLASSSRAPVAIEVAIRVVMDNDLDSSCDYCETPAEYLVATGADPDNAPLCPAHTREMLMFLAKALP